jgi:hypothetical protein
VTTQLLYLFNCLYLILLVVVAVFTRPTPRRLAGALAGSAVDGVVALAGIVVGERAGWWHMAITWEPYFLMPLWLALALSGFVFLITWRIARRFGWRGLAVALLLAAVLGPVRDYSYMAKFPEWGSYGPGYSPALAISAMYVLLGVVGHGLMRLTAGPAAADRLARAYFRKKEMV